MNFLSKNESVLLNKSGLCGMAVDCKTTWCGNCGNYGIQNALKRALVLEGLGKKDVLLCFDVGCSGNGSDKIDLFTIHGLHGRVLPLAAGCKLGNPSLEVIASAGDGATFSEGVGHLVHAVRNEYNITFIFHNNENYGLTTGQPSSLTRVGTKMNAAPEGVTESNLNACQFVLGLKPSFVARSYSGRVDHMTEMIREGINHNGFSFIEIMQACPTYNKATPDEWYEERFFDIESLVSNSEYDKSDIWEARKMVDDIEDRIAMGVLYRA